MNEMAAAVLTKAALTLLLWACLLTLCAAGILFKVRDGWHVPMTCGVLQREWVASVQQCARLCELHQHCALGTWRAGGGGGGGGGGGPGEGGSCCLGHRHLSFQPAAPREVPERGSSYFVKEPQPDFRQFQDGWNLIFRGEAGGGVPFYPQWYNSATSNDDQHSLADVLSGCWSLQEQSCPVPSRSQVIDRWTTANVKQVRLSVYVNGTEAAHVVMNATGSTATSWMDKNRVISSSWTDLASGNVSVFAFRIRGVPVHFWRFLIMRGIGYCGIDNGWLVVKDQGYRCNWETDSPRPVILYASGSSYVRFDDMEAANLLAVFVKY